MYMRQQAITLDRNGLPLRYELTLIIIKISDRVTERASVS